MNIALKQLKVFVMVAKEKTITAASEKLFLSKPAVSMALTELEKNIGHKLFDRHNNRLLINHHGKRLLPLADELLKRTLDIESLFLDQDKLVGKLNIGCSDTIGNQIIPYLLQNFRSETGHVNQDVIINNTAAICQDISEFKLDIGLVEGAVSNNQLMTIPWLTDDMCIICHPEHPLSKLKSMTLNDIEEHSWILRESGSGTRDYFMNNLTPKLHKWSIAFELTNTQALINFVSCNLGLALLSYHSAKHAIDDGRVVSLSVPLEISRQYSLVYHKEKYQSPLIQAFIEYCERWDLK
ncbi:LysR substrate-binding domain-containing protein [Vibrio sp. SS-MA-C1-2]|uniref:LysR substrate-binding domain-containing protein n=1 Tax=Vibrio sp. SS-MA-C1-2 TaxID=2908646 RepID=UPI001F3FC7FA|nr:LysR substrate-binding domain-containing protein [Vibrio sp. SS-MA-C1-2]UJF18930.1 LysR substrate-binding domain-containing protein [Vibrio sp. SS-MA-C1-2]